ncbi:MAG: hypothetical protein HYT27_00275 [Parcubacteria group bacterium]|nr:hypothetical protein [Parcubacteria group bacterium]
MKPKFKVGDICIITARRLSGVVAISNEGNVCRIMQVMHHLLGDRDIIKFTDPRYRVQFYSGREVTYNENELDPAPESIKKRMIQIYKRRRKEKKMKSAKELRMVTEQNAKRIAQQAGAKDERERIAHSRSVNRKARRLWKILKRECGKRIRRATQAGEFSVSIWIDAVVNTVYEHKGVYECALDRLVEISKEELTPLGFDVVCSRISRHGMCDQTSNPVSGGYEGGYYGVTGTDHYLEVSWEEEILSKSRNKGKTVRLRVKSGHGERKEIRGKGKIVLSRVRGHHRIYKYKLLNTGQK